MANKINISFSTIFKRKCCLESEVKGIVTDAKRSYEISDQLLESIMEDHSSINPSLNINISEFMKLSNNSENANKYFREGLSILSKLCEIQEMGIIDENYVSSMVDKYIFEVMPYVENNEAIRETAKRCNLPKQYEEKIINYAGLYEVADRILLNYKHISNRFNILEEIRKAKYRDLQSIVENCCEMIDTYKVPSYAKFNLCIEEMNYLLEKENIKYNKSDLVRFITEYFLLHTPEISEKELDKYRRVLRENTYITPEDLRQVSFLTGDDSRSDIAAQYDIEDTNGIQQTINAFLLKTEKTENDLLDIFLFIEKYERTLDIKNSLHKAFWLLWLVYRKEIFDNEQIRKDMYQVIIPSILRRLEENDFSKADLQKIIQNLLSINDLIVIGSQDTTDYVDNAVWFKAAMDHLTDLIEKLICITYSDYNIESINFVNHSDTEPISLQEFKIFKFHNLIRASMEIDKYLKYKSKNIYEKGNKKVRRTVKKIKDVLFPESDETLYKVIGEDGKADLCMAQYVYEEADYGFLSEFLEDTCYEINSILNTITESAKCFYIMNPGVAEIHLKESTPISLTEEEQKLVQEQYDDSMDVYVESFAYTMSCLKELDPYSEGFNMNEFLYNMKEKDITKEQFLLALEAMSFLDIEEEQVKLFAEKYNEYRYYNAILESVEEESEYKLETSQINKAVNQWEKIDESLVTLDMRVDAMQLLEAILEATPDLKNKILDKKKAVTDKIDAKKQAMADKKNVNPEEETKERKRNPFKGINLNSMKLYLEGLKKKARDMSSKEKEVSRNIDNNFRRLVKAMKDSLVSDRREAIIKGSVIPSFSRCIKICVGLAGLGIATGNPIVPLVTAIGGFAASKNLTRKERILLLDEIETELEVVDKEISMAESKNQMKKYRTLLKYKKDLQRQYQRIRYNVRVGKDLLPGSTTGLRNSD